MSKPDLTSTQASDVLRDLEQRVRRIDTRVTIIGNAVGAPFNINTRPHLMPNGAINLPSRHTTMSDILAVIEASESSTAPLMLDGTIVAVITKM